MTNLPNNQAEQRTDDGPTINRRNVLKTVGTAGGGFIALSASAGQVAAGDTPDQLYFCGCSQLVVTGLTNATVTVYLRRTEDGDCRTREIDTADCTVGGGREEAYRYTVTGGEAILAVGTPDGNIWCNPNNCAQKWLDSLECFDVSGTLRGECTDTELLDDPGDVFTSRCGTVCNGSNESDNGRRGGRGKRGGP